MCDGCVGGRRVHVGRSVHSSGEKSVCRRWGVGEGRGTKGEEEGGEEGGGASLYTYHKFTNRNASGIAR